MSEVRIPKQDKAAGLSPEPDIRLVTSPDHADDGTMESRRKDRLVRIAVEVDGNPRDLWVNISEGTLGSTKRPLTDYFERYEAETKKRDSNGILVGDFGMSRRLAQQALEAAIQLASMAVIELPNNTTHSANEVIEQSTPEEAPLEGEQAA
jgi:hypothetical protein